MNRRRFIALGTALACSGAAGSSARTAPVPASSFGIDAARFGLRPGSDDDQSRALQRAIDEAARMRTPLAIAPGTYRVGGITLRAGTQIVGVRAASKFVFTDGPSLLAAAGADDITLSGLSFDGLRRRLPAQRGLLHIETARHLKISDCTLQSAGGNGIHCVGVDGEISGVTIADSVDAGLHSLDARGLSIVRNIVTGAGNNGIQIWRSGPGDDGTIIAGNRIEAILNTSGGSGQFGNAINVFRAGNVIVRGNRISNCAFSAVRGNAASNILVEGNSIGDVREVAIYSEFGFEGALIAGNIVDGAAIGVSVTNFNEGGRLAVIHGNVIRNLLASRPAGTDAGDGAGIGIAAEADTAITGNVVENAPTAGLVLGFGQYLRDVTATGNVVRRTGIGIAVSVSAGAGPALIANNMISEFTRGAIMGMDRRTVATGDLIRGGSERYANLTISGNRAR